MDNLRKPAPATEIKIFDPRDCTSGSGGAELLDASVVRRNEQWWIYLAGQVGGYRATDIFSASLLPRVSLSATGWRLTHNAGGALAPLAGRSFTLRLGWQGRTALPVVSERMGPPAQTHRWNEFTMPARLRTSGGRTGSAFCNGIAKIG